MDNTVAGTILEISRQLNDQDASIPNGNFVRWPKIDLLEYLNDGIIQIAVYRPDVCITSGSLIPGPGIVQRLPLGIKELISIDYATVPGCPGQVYMNRVDQAFAKTFQRDTCIAPPMYRPYNWAYEAVNPSTYFIYPAIPAGINITLSAVYRADIPQFTDPDAATALPYHNKYHGALVTWMLARAYEVDHESTTSILMAKERRADFFRIMADLTKVDQALHSGALLAPGRRR